MLRSPRRFTRLSVLLAPIFWLSSAGMSGTTLDAADGKSASATTVIRWQTLTLDTDFYSEGATAGDLNNDGQMDVISGPFWYPGPNFNTRLRYYDGKVFDPHGYSDNFFTYVEDLNGDGKSDVLMIGFPGQAAFWFENPVKPPG